MLDAETLAAYDKYAHAYDAGVVDFWDNFPKDFIARFAASLPGKRVLNMGSGSGRDALLLREHGLEVVCMDASKSMVAITTGLGFESHQAVLTNPPFEPETFDGIWAYGSLLHLPKAATNLALAAMHSLLRPQGGCAIGVIQGKDEARLAHEIMPKHHRFFKFYEPDELDQLLTNASFTPVERGQYDPGYDIFLNHRYQVQK